VLLPGYTSEARRYNWLSAFALNGKQGGDSKAKVVSLK